MPCGHTHRRSGSPQPSFRLPPTVIPAQAGIYALRSHSPSSRLPQPSFRRKPEPRACGHIHRHSDSPNRHSGSPNRHSGASRNPGRVVTLTVILAPPNCHSGLRRNLCAAMDSGFRRNDGSIPKPPEKKHYRRPRCVLGGLTFRIPTPPAIQARLPPGLQPPSVPPPALSTQSRKLPREIAPNPLANRTNVLYPTFSKSGSPAVGRTSPASHAKVHGAPPDL